MDCEPLYASTDATMDSIIKLMAAHDTSGLPIVDSNKALVGFISDGDVAAYLGRNDLSLFDSALNLYRFVDDSDINSRFINLLNLNVMDIATKHVISVSQDAPLDAAVHILSERRIKKVPVIDSDDHLVGTLSRRNIMHALAEEISRVESNQGNVSVN